MIQWDNLVTTIPFPQRTYFPFCIDNRMIAFLHALCTYNMLRDDIGWVRRNVHKLREKVTRTYMYMLRGPFVFE